MNFAELCREVGSRCEITGYASINPESSTGEHGKVVSWTREAWVSLQQQHEWTFLRRDFSFTTALGQSTYLRAAIQAEGAPVRAIDVESVRCWRESIGRADEQFMVEWDWDEWYDTFGFGIQPQSRPQVFTIRPEDSAFVLGPLPDDIYRISGKYWRQAQRLTQAADTPVIDDEMHMAIVFKAMLTYANRESAAEIKLEATERLDEVMSLMRRRYLPAGSSMRPLA